MVSFLAEPGIDATRDDNELCRSHAGCYFRRRSSLPDLVAGCPMCSDEEHQQKKPLAVSHSVGDMSPTQEMQSGIDADVKSALRRTLSDFSTRSHTKRRRVLHNPDQGEIKLSFQYLPGSRRFKVRLLRAEKLGNSDDGVHSFVTLALKPSRHKKMQSSVVPNSRNPVYNEDFFIPCDSLDQLHKSMLKVKVYNRAKGTRELLGQTFLDLKNFDLVKENRTWCNLVEDSEVHYSPLKKQFVNIVSLNCRILAAWRCAGVLSPTSSSSTFASSLDVASLVTVLDSLLVSLDYITLK
jgi:hypothetical protein